MHIKVLLKVIMSIYIHILEKMVDGTILKCRYTNIIPAIQN
jgi:hypothetical protein